MKFASYKAKEILLFWFGENIPYDEQSAIEERARQVWFAQSEKIDQEIRKRFEPDLEAVTEPMVEEIEDILEKLAMIILVDQFSRNIFREDSRAFVRDHLGLKLAKQMVAQNEDMKLKPFQRFFVYLPLEHSEDQKDQEVSVAKFKKLSGEVPKKVRGIYQSFLDYAIKHKVIIDKFGRYPHRNEALGRKSTKEELEFLKEPSSHFGR